MDLSELFDQPFFLPYRKLFKLFTSWEEVVGKEFGKKSEPAGIKNGVLTIIVDDELTMTEMHFVKKEIMEAVNRWMGEAVVEEIKILCEKRKGVRSPKRRGTQKPVIPLEVRKVLDSISDGNLRNLLERFAEAVLLTSGRNP